MKIVNSFKNLFKFKTDYIHIKPICDGDGWLLDATKKSIYFYDSNIFKNFTNKLDYEFARDSFVGRKVYLTKQQYCKKLDNVNFVCDCEVGDGSPDIVKGKRYNIIEEYNNAQSNYFIEAYGDSYAMSRYKVYDGNCGNFLFDINRDYRIYSQQACLNCEKCLDEKSQLIKYTRQRIDVLADAIKKEKSIEERVNLICEGN